MSLGLIALIDDVAMIARAAAASLDDVAVQATKAGAKAAGVVIDDAAVTPRYAIGFAAEREWPIIRRIALGSLRNKLLVLLPAALGLGYFAPQLVTPLLMLGGLYLVFEGAEKVWEALFGGHAPALEEGNEPEASPAEREAAMVSGAIRTDFVLSAEIMAITLGSVSGASPQMQFAVLALVGIFITLAVYGAVGLLVKMDDFGLWLARRGRGKLMPALGRGLVRAMPRLLDLLGVIGIIAMVWVGGGILLHGLDTLGWPALPHALHSVQDALAARLGVPGGLIEPLVSGLFGLAAGLAVLPFAHAFAALREHFSRARHPQG